PLRSGLAPGPTIRVSGADIAGQFLPYRAPRLAEQRHVDRLVRHAHLRIVGELLHHPTRDLRRRPPQLELRLHRAPKPSTRLELRQRRTTSTPHRSLVRPTRPISPPSTIRYHLTRDRRRRPAQPPRDRPQRLATRKPTRDLLAFSERQPQPRPHRF